MWRRILRHGAVCLGLVTLAACSPSSPPASQGRVVVRYWEKWTGFEAEAMRRVVDDFNASQNRIYVDFSSVSELDRKIMLATSGGVPPDVAGVWSRALTGYVENNALTPLDKLAAEAGVRREDYIDVYWQLCTHRDHLWALPSTPASVGLVWNKKLFRAAGLDPDRPPRSIAELEAFNKKLTQYRPDGHLQSTGFLPEEPGWWNGMWGFWFGASLWDGKGTVTANSPGNLAAYRWVQSYPERLGVDNLLAFHDGFGNFASPQNPFLSGRLAMELQGVWIYNYIKTYAPADFEWGVAAFPSDEPDKLPDVSIVETDELAIPLGAPHPHEAFEFLRYVNSQAPMEKLCLGQLKFSPLRECSADFLARHPNPYIKEFIALAKSPHARFAPQLADWNEFAREMRNAAGKIWAGKETAAVALDGVQRHEQKVLDQQQKRWDRLAPDMLAQWKEQP